MARVEGRAETLTSVHSTLRESFLASDLAENHQIPRSLARVTLAAVLNNERNPTPNSNVVRTLLDIIRAEESLANHPNRHHFAGKTTWKSFKERLKLRRNTANPTCSLHNHNDWMPTTSAPQPDAISPQVQILTQNSLRDTLRMSDSSGADSALPENDTVMREEGDQRRRSIRLSDALAAEREERSRMSRELEATREGSSGTANVGDGEIAQEEEEPVRMSLMDLLEETERQSGLLGPIYRFDDDHDGEEGVEVPDANEEVVEKGVEGVAEVSCCVCMVRHKGAAFIPCGHTFCRMCSRELWVQRGHCPLCNSFILEVLDIF